MFNCTSRRHFREADIVRKRVAEESRIQKWSTVQGYYKACDLSNSRLAHWQGTLGDKIKTPEMCIIEERKQNLEIRRQQLKNLFAGEMLEWSREKNNCRSHQSSPMMQNLTSSDKNSTSNFVTVTGEKLGELSTKDEQERIEVDNFKLEYLMGNLRLDEEQLNKLDVEDGEKLKKLLNLQKLYHSLSEYDCNLDTSLPRFEQWKNTCLKVQEKLKKAVSFIQQMRCSVGDFQTSVGFLDKLLQQEKSLQECLKTESSEDRFSRLLEQTRREPYKKWFHGEMEKWNREGRERVKQIGNIYFEFQLLVKDWAERNQDKISVLLESGD